MEILLDAWFHNIRFHVSCFWTVECFSWVRGCSRSARHKGTIENDVENVLKGYPKSLGKCIFVIKFTKVYFVMKGKFYTMYASVFGRFKPDRYRKSSQRFFFYTQPFCERGVPLSLFYFFLYETYLNNFFIQLMFACQLPCVYERRKSSCFLS